VKNKIEQLNQSYLRAISQIIMSKLSVSNFTVTAVLVAASRQSAKVYIKADLETIKLLQLKSGQIQNELPKFIKSRYIPKLTILEDTDYSQRMDDLFEKINN